MKACRCVAPFYCRICSPVLPIMLPPGLYWRAPDGALLEINGPRAFPAHTWQAGRRRARA